MTHVTLQHIKSCQISTMVLTAGGHVDGPEEESTSGASTTDSAHRGLVAPTLRSDSSVHRQLCNQLRDLEDENKK